MSKPINPPIHPVAGAIYTEEATGIVWVWTGVSWIRAGTSEVYSSPIKTGMVLTPGFYSGPSGSDLSTIAPQYGPTAPPNPSFGQIWIDTSNAAVPISYIWVDPGSWKKFSESTNNTFTRDTDPALDTDPAIPLDDGDIWFNTTTAQLRVYVSGSWQLLATGGGPVNGNYGDITVSNGGTDWQINDDAVGSQELKNTGVVPGLYTLANVTVGADGRVIEATNGSAVVGRVEDKTYGDVTVSNSGQTWRLIPDSVGPMELIPTGVKAGQYISPTVTVAADGRILTIKDGEPDKFTMKRIDTYDPDNLNLPGSKDVDFYFWQPYNADTGEYRRTEIIPWDDNLGRYVVSTPRSDEIVFDLTEPGQDINDLALWPNKTSVTNDYVPPANNPMLVTLNDPFDANDRSLITTTLISRHPIGSTVSILFNIPPIFNSTFPTDITSGLPVQPTQLLVSLANTNQRVFGFTYHKGVWHPEFTF